MQTLTKIGGYIWPECVIFDKNFFQKKKKQWGSKHRLSLIQFRLEYITLEYRTCWSSYFQWFGFGMVSYSKSYSYGPEHSTTKPLEIRTKWCHFVQISNSFRHNHAILFKTEHHWKTKYRVTIGIPNTIQMSEISLIDQCYSLTKWMIKGALKMSRIFHVLVD